MSRRYEIAPISDEEIKAEERRVFFSENGDDTVDRRAGRAGGAARSDPSDGAAHAPYRPRGSSR